MSNKEIWYKPKSVADAKAALLLGREFGRVINHIDWVQDSVVVAEASKGWIRFSEEGRAYWSSLEPTGQFLLSLDALLDALSKPVKEPKQINTAAKIEGVMCDTVEVTLTPTGGVKVKCHEFPKESFERIHREWLEYNKAE